MKPDNKLIYKVLMVLTSLLLFSATGTAMAEEALTPQALVKNAAAEMFKEVKDHKVELKQSPGKIYALVDQLLTPHFDFEKMSKLALGRNWRIASATQRTRFTEQFRLLLIRTYSTAMLEYTDEEINFLPFRGDVSSKKVKVYMEITQTSGPAIPMAFSLYQNDSDDWKIYDIKIDGISLVTNYRSSFASTIRKSGIDKLIDDLAKRNEKVKV